MTSRHRHWPAKAVAGAVAGAVATSLLTLTPAGQASSTASPGATDGRQASSAAADTRDARPAGTVLRVRPLKKSLRLRPARRTVVLTYLTQDTFGTTARSTGTVAIPKGKAPRGGWPVVSWAHGTSGLGDSCAPSVSGPALPSRDRPYLSRWLREGYAVVASDYAGLGTPGLHAYLDGRTSAHNIVDMVKAARNYTRGLPRNQRLARRWVAVGQSQGAGAAIYAARYATKFGGKQLDYRGAVGTGTPAYIEELIQVAGPGVPPVPLTPALTAYLTYIVASLRYARPDLGINSILTPYGKKYVRLSKKLCTLEFEERLGDVSMGRYFTAPVLSLPGFRATVAEYMKMPESGFDKPFFMGHGALDVDVPYATTLVYANRLLSNGEPVTFRTYPSDHSGTLTRSQADIISFVDRITRRG